MILKAKSKKEIRELVKKYYEGKIFIHRGNHTLHLCTVPAKDSKYVISLKNLSDTESHIWSYMAITDIFKEYSTVIMDFGEAKEWCKRFRDKYVTMLEIVEETEKKLEKN